MARRSIIVLVLIVSLPLGALVNEAPVARAAPIDPVICDGPYPLTNTPQYGTAYRTMMLPEIVSGAPARGGYAPPETPRPRDWGPTTPQECVQLSLNEPWIPVTWLESEPPGPSPSNPCPALTVSGRFFTVDEANRIVPVPWVEVYLWDYDINGIPSPGGPPSRVVLTNFLSRAITDWDGFFSSQICNRRFEDDPNDGQPGRDEVVDLLAQFVTRSSASIVSRWYFGGLSISEVTDSVYSGTTRTFPNVDPSGVGTGEGSFYIGDWVADWDFRWAALAYRKSMLIWDKLANGNLQVPTTPDASNGGDAAIHYLAPCSPRDPCDVDGAGAQGEPFPHYQVAGADCKWPDRGGGGIFDAHPDDQDCPRFWRYLDWQIHLDDKADVMSRHTFGHLYGHFLMQWAYGGWYPGVGPSHGDCPLTETPPGCESRDDTEGRVGDFEDPTLPACPGSYVLRCQERLSADFGPVVAWAEGWADFFATRTVNYAPDASYQITRPDLTTWTVDFETGDASWSGDQDEGRVASALNDIFDAANDGVDQYESGWTRIWDALSLAGAASFRGYWSVWNTRLLGDGAQVSGARLSILQNDIAYWGEVRETWSGATVIYPTPVIAVDSGGNFHLAWTANEIGHYQIFYRKLNQKWSYVSGQSLTSAGFNAQDPGIALAGNGPDVYVVWAENRGTNLEIYQRVYQSSSSTWVPEQQITTDAADSRDPSIVGDTAGNVYYIWRDITPGGSSQTERVWFRKNSEAPTSLYHCTGPSISPFSRVGFPDIALGASGVIHAVFSVGPGCPDSPGDTRMYYDRFDGTQWGCTEATGASACTLLGTDVDWPRRLRVDADGAGHVYAVWEQWNGASGFDVSYRKSDTEGIGAWSSELVFDQDGTGSYEVYPDIARGGNAEVFMIYAHKGADTSNQYEIRFKRSADHGSTFPLTVQLTNAVGDSYIPRVSGEPAFARVGAVWRDSRQRTEVFFGELTFATGPSPPPSDGENDGDDEGGGGPGPPDPCPCPTSPTLWSWDGRRYVIENDLLPTSAADPSRFVGDWYVVQAPPSPGPDGYSFQISEPSSDRSYLDKVSLVSLSHDSDVRVTITDRGEIVTWNRPKSVRSATDPHGTDWTSNLKEADGSAYYRGSTNSTLYVSFGKVGDVNRANLIVRTAKKCPSCISVDIQNAHGEWLHVGSATSRAFWDFQVINLSGQVPLLRPGAVLRLAWMGDADLDWVGLDTSEPARVTVRPLPLAQAFTEDGSDIRPWLTDEDGALAVLDPGERIWLLFDSEPDRERGMTYVFATVGRYELLVQH